MKVFEKSIPYTLPWDHAPVDISAVFASERPAGRHGFLTVKGDRFAFEDGTDARFWGTNFNSGACFPSHGHSDKVAARLAQFGVNMVRMHQMDAEWSTPNIFAFTKGGFPKNTRSLDPRSLDSLDYLIARLKEQGIYVYLDLLTYRRFRSGDGVDSAELLGDAAKPYACFDRRLIDLQKEFNEQLWTHVNPYTGLAYQADPAIALTEVVNECDLFSGAVVVEPYRTALEQRFVDWCRSTGRPEPAMPVDFGSADPAVVDFLVGAQQAYYREIIDHLRSIGVRIPVTGTNWTRHIGLLECQMVTDFTDSHVYWYDWNWKVDDKRFSNRSMLGERTPMIRDLGFFRAADKPFIVSEWDDPWPNEWRAESVLFMASVAALQGWQGALVHTYRYSTREDVDCIGQPITSDAIGGVFYRGGVFDTFNDPAKFGLFYHAALILRRGDVTVARTSVEVDARRVYHDGKLLAPANTAALDGGLEQHRIAMRVEGEPGDGLIDPETRLLPPGAKEIRSDNGQLFRAFEGRYATIDTPRTKAVYGFLGNAGRVAVDGLEVTMRTGFGVIALSSLTDDPIERSCNLLLTAVGRADNTGSVYNDDHTVQNDVGHGPIRVEIVEADIALTTDVPHLRIWSVNPDGFLIGLIPAERRDGKLRFSLGTAFPSMYYLIQKA